MHEGRSNLCKEGRSSHTKSMCQPSSINVYICIYTFDYLSARRSLLTISASTRDARSCAKRDAHRTLTLCVYIYIYRALVLWRIDVRSIGRPSAPKCHQKKISWSGGRSRSTLLAVVVILQSMHRAICYGSQ